MVFRLKNKINIQPDGMIIYEGTIYLGKYYKSVLNNENSQDRRG